jgi:hypothetical protein
MSAGAAAALLVALAGGHPAWADPPSGSYQGWEWSTGVFVEPTSVEEEYCSGEMLFEFEPDLNWTVDGPEQACWGRTTTTSSRALFGLPLTAEAFHVRSTRPLVGAGGNLYEVYGENVVESVGEGEQRIGTLLVEPTGADLAIFGLHVALAEEGSQTFVQAIDFAVSATPAVIEERTAADLEGTSWRLFAFGQRPSPLSVSNEILGGALWTLNLGEAGACSYSVSSVFPEVLKNGDSFLDFQTSISSDLNNRIVRGGVSGGEFQTCSYTIDADGYLAVNSPRVLDPPQIGSQTLLPRLAISDDQQYLVLAPNANGVASDPQTLNLGYRVAPDMAPNAIDGDFLVHVAQFQYLATGTATTNGHTGIQEADVRGRGLLRFDSSTERSTPEGESGTWYACEADLAVDDIELGYTGNVLSANVAISSEVDSQAFIPDFCAFQLSFDGALRVHLARDQAGTEDDFAATLRGYVNRTEEVLTLLLPRVDPVEPRAVVDRNEASMLALVGMRYTGDVDGDADEDALKNLEEFQYPEPEGSSSWPYGCARGELPIVCSVPDVNGDGVDDVAVVDQTPITAAIRDGQSNTLLGSLNFLGDGADYEAISATVLPDLDGDDVPELAVLALRQSDSRIAVQIRNLDGAGAARLVWYATGHTPVAIDVIDDVDENGVPELAVLSRRNSDARGVVEVKNAFGDANKRTLWSPQGFEVLDLGVVSDANGDGLPEVAVLSTRNSDGRILVQVRNAEETAAPLSLLFAKGQNPIDLAVVPDKDADGIPEVAVLSSRISDGRLLMELQNAAGPNANRNQVWLPTGYIGLAMEPVAPAEGVPVPEVAVLARRSSDNKGVVLVKRADGVDKPRTLWYPDGFTPHNFRVLADLDANGVEEAGVLLTRNSDGRVLVQSRNASGAYGTRNYWFTP